jgi:predicted kinase
MAAITAMRGLPASGKSTRARQIQAEVRAGGSLCMIVSRDVLRDMLGVGWSGGPRAESVVTAMQHAMVRAALAAGADVVIDDTNLHPVALPGWQKLAAETGAELRIVDVDTDVEVCVARDAQRPEVDPDDGLCYGRRVGEAVIRRLAAGRMTPLQVDMHTRT